MEMNLIQEVRAGLDRCRGHWPALAADSDVPYTTLVKVASGETKNPRYLTLEALAKAIRAREAQVAGGVSP